MCKKKRTESINSLNKELTIASQKQRKLNHELSLSLKVKNDFLATISHEIRTPMNGINGISELLGDTNLDSEQLNYVKTIQRSNQQLICIIDDILDFSMFENSDIEIENTTTNLFNVFNDCGAIFSQTAIQKELLFYISENADTPEYVICDVVKLRQVIIKLLSNAFKFTEAGSIEISATFDAKTQSENTLIITIKDTGIGVSNENMAVQVSV